MGSKPTSAVIEKKLPNHQEHLDKTHQGKHINHRCAEVAELVDALGSGSSARTGVGVRLSSSAPLIFQGFSPSNTGLKPFFCLHVLHRLFTIFHRPLKQKKDGSIQQPSTKSLSLFQEAVSPLQQDFQAPNRSKIS
jgi:hypothetical protein